MCFKFIGFNTDLILLLAKSRLSITNNTKKTTISHFFCLKQKITHVTTLLTSLQPLYIPYLSYIKTKEKVERNKSLKAWSFVILNLLLALMLWDVPP
jgi:transcriptional accessory protein Tex/SPT6